MGWGWVDGGGWVGGAPHTSVHAHTCTHAHMCMFLKKGRFVTENIAGVTPVIVCPVVCLYH